MGELSVAEVFILLAGCLLLLILSVLNDSRQQIRHFVSRIADRYIARTTPIMSPDGDAEHAASDLASQSATTAMSDVAGVATPNNASNEALRIAVERAKIEALAALILESERKPFANGKIAETRALNALFGVTPSSSATSEYQRLRTLLKAALAGRPTAPTYQSSKEEEEQIQERRRELGLNERAVAK
jgi:hypothetical protein